MKHLMIDTGLLILVLIVASSCAGEREKALPQGAGPEAVRAAHECDRDDLAACKRLAEMFQVGSNGLAADKEKAKALQEYACGKGLGDACKGEEERFVESLSAETGEKYDEATGYARACDGGGMTACLSLAGMFEKGRGGMPTNRVRAAHLLVRACKGKNDDACRYARAYLENAWIEGQDLSDIFPVADAACDGGDEGWCQSYGDCIVKGICRPTKDRHCRSTSWCSEKGACANANGKCIAAKDDDCRPSAGCKESGLCSALDGVCLAAKDSDCAQSAVCRGSGSCSAVAGACAIGKDADCRRSPGCAEDGLCSFRDGRCIATSDSDCRSSSVCRSLARCWVKDGSCFDRDRQCKASSACRERGLCKATEGGCEAGKEEDCRGSRNCAVGGQCSLRSGKCLATTESECRNSEGCSTGNRCSLGGSGECVRIVSEEEKAGLVIREGNLIWIAETITGVYGKGHMVPVAGSVVWKDGPDVCTTLALGPWAWRLPTSDEMSSFSTRHNLRNGCYALSSSRKTGSSFRIKDNFCSRPGLSQCVANAYSVRAK